ncbi:MAG: hypothetical protein GY846_08000 [Deltaproteobacteria bacterium]|nr:hypothetical protein [Deltaproteobacteria bacterium]
MDAMKPEALSARIRLLSVISRNGDEWCRIIGKFFQGIAKRCETDPQDVIIGHIKGLALFAEGKHLRVSVISSSYLPEFEASADLEEDSVPLSINVIVYGLSAGSLEQIVCEKIASLNDLSGIEAVIKTMSAAHQPPLTIKGIITNMSDGQKEEIG